MLKRINAACGPFLSKPYWFPAFVLLLVLFPLPFGGNRPLFSNLFAFVSGLLLLFAVWDEYVTPPSLQGTLPRKRLLLSTAGITLVIFWTFIQAAPWTPASWHHPIWQEASLVLGSVKGSISVDPSLFPESLARMATYICFFILALLASRDPAKAKAIINSLAIAAVLYALYGLIVESTGSNTILWYPKWAYSGFLTSTFVNKNSYATYAGLGLICCLAVVWQHYKKIEPHDQIIAKRSKAIAFFISMGVKDYLYLLMPLCVLGALSLSGSRAGIMASALGVLVFFFALAVNLRWGKTRWFSISTVSLVFFVIFLAVGGDAFVGRISEGQINDDLKTRLAAYDLQKLAVQDNPWLGFGLGTFESAFRLYRDSSLPVWFHHAHNDYLEMVMDLGIPAFTLFLTSVLLLVSCCLSGIWHRRRGAIYPAIALAATAIVGTHALVDFSFHIPAVSATYASLLGVGVGQSWSSRSAA